MCSSLSAILARPAYSRICGPGVNNWDASIAKSFRIVERVQLRVRIEAYNAFNHTQFAAVNTSAQFNPATGGVDHITTTGGTNVVLGGVGGDVIAAPGGDNIILGSPVKFTKENIDQFDF